MSVSGEQPVGRPVRAIGTRLGGTRGNEALTSTVASVLTVLLAAEGVTLLDLHGLRTPHMFIGIALIGPVLVKLGSTGWRFARYYLGARPYREKGPPLLALRLLAPVLVASTIGVLASGVALLAAGHHSDTLMLVHKASFIIWAAVFAVHFLAYALRAAGAVRDDWRAARAGAGEGSSLRVALVTSA